MKPAQALGGRWTRVSVAVILALAISFPAGQRAAAASIQVTTSADELNSDGDCSLREAIRAANTNLPVDACVAGTSNDTLTLPAGTYTLALPGRGEDGAATGDLDLTSLLTIVGAGPDSTFVDGGQIDRVFDVRPNASVTLKNFTIRHGNAAQGGGLSNAGNLILNHMKVSNNTAYQSYQDSASFGGGIYNSGTLSITQKSLVTNNTNAGCCFTATSGSNLGGGIFNSGTLLMNDSTVSWNTVTNISGPTFTSGGGIHNDGQATLTKTTINNNTVDQCCGGGITNQGSLKMTNSTISGNQSTHGMGGGLDNAGTAILNNITVAFNAADVAQTCSPTCQGGGIYNYGQVYLTNSLLAQNTGGAPDCGGAAITSQGYNLIQNLSGCTISGNTTGNIYSVNPKLQPLANNGPTATHYLNAGSPAIDSANPAVPGSGGNACPKLDQRGTARPRDGNRDGSARCDIGAVERL